MSAELKAHLRQRIEEWSVHYAKDFANIPDEQLAASPSGVARAPIDFTFEVAFVNRRVASRLRGEEVPPYKQDGWIKAPNEFLDKEKMLEEFNASIQDVLKALDGLPADQLEKEIETPNGKMSPSSLLNLIATHITYHDGQLNYIQALYGDDAVHWSD